MQDEDQLALLAGPGGVDPDWYRARYPDVAMLGMDPALHYLRYGAPMGRRPNPGFDTRFYAASHADVAPADPMGGLTPLVHYLTQGAADGRPASPEALRAALDAVAARAAADWPLPPAVQGRPDPVISYCIPVMNRPDDIKGTLAFNLAQVRGLERSVEFILLFYDQDQETHDWVRAQFGPELASGLLRLEFSDALDTWHFGRAKNGFRGLMRGQIYSSLDGDNFVTRAETEQLLDVWHEYGDHFVFHHFSGNWGDGTSGRVSLPAAIYRTVGYADRFLPRQYDEIDLILSALRQWPAMPFLCHDAERNALSLSKRTRDFRAAARIGNRIVAMPQPARHAPLNPKGEGYTAEDPLLKAMSDFNQFTCYMTNARDEDHRAAMLAAVVAARHRVIDAMDPGRILPVLFETATQPDPLPPAEPGTVSLFACVKNDDAFLPALVAHYRARGVGRFLIVDDGSDTPVRDLLPDADVRVFRPKVGSFLTAKGMWLEGLMKAHLPEGGWALVVDADEFIDLPPGVDGFPALAARLEAQGRDIQPGLMLDMLPGPAADPAALERGEQDFARLFDHVCRMPGPVSEPYRSHKAVAWGFGPHAALSWTVDARFHAFGTVDSLRKLPLIRWRTGRHLNQGFHTLHYTDDTKAPGTEIWEAPDILPVRHYKLVKLFSTAAREAALKLAEGYHARTAGNIRRIFGETDTTARLLALPQTPYDPALIAAIRTGTAPDPAVASPG